MLESTSRTQGKYVMYVPTSQSLSCTPGSAPTGHPNGDMVVIVTDHLKGFI